MNALRGEPRLASTATSLVLFGGFLGAGKTTALLALAQRWVASGKRVGIITNDQASDLVDTQSFRLAGFEATEVAGGCFCCRFDHFIASADELLARTQPDIILAEPVGSCTDIVATVLNPLKALYPDRFAIAPFVVLVDPVRALKVLGRTERVGLSERVTYIYRMQQQEADAIAIGKIDLLAPSERARVEGLLQEQFPGRPVIGFSALTGEGLDALFSYLESDNVSARALEGLDYDVYAAGEAELGWFNCKVRLGSPDPLPLDATLLEFARELLNGCRQRELEIAHGKLLATAGGHVAILNMTDTAGEPVVSRVSSAVASEMELTINLRIQASPQDLDEVVQASLAQWTGRQGFVMTPVTGRSFSPPRPVPTHRMAEGEPQAQ